MQLLEEELDKAEKDLRETTEKCARNPTERHPSDGRLRQVDVKAEHFERQVTRVEQERDEWERKHGVSAGRAGRRMGVRLTCRRPSRSTSSPSGSWTRLSRRWRAWYVVLDLGHRIALTGQ